MLSPRARGQQREQIAEPAAPSSSSSASSGDLADLNAPLAPRDAIDNVLDKLRLIAILARRTFGYLGFGWLWFSSLVRLVIYSFILWPGFFLVALFYFFSDRVHRNIWYGRQARNLLDMYIPYRNWLQAGKVPVVVFVTGGAWTIGYKAWGALLARRLSQRGILVACLDYRNFPQGSVDDMVEDVMDGTAWVISHAASYGGDPQQVYLMGQSCGGHLAALALLRKAELQRCVNEEKLSTKPRGDMMEQPLCFDSSDSSADATTANTPSNAPLSPEQQATCVEVMRGRRSGRGGLHRRAEWYPDQVKGFVGLSCPYDIKGIQAHFRKRGMNAGMLHGIFDPQLLPQCESGSAEYTFADVSPYELCQSLDATDAAKLPQTLLLHGSADKTVPASESIRMAHALVERGVRARCKVYEKATHTSIFVEGPFAGGVDVVLEDVLDFVLQDSSPQRLQSLEAFSESWAMIPFPRLLSALATFVCPF